MTIKNIQPKLAALLSDESLKATMVVLEASATAPVTVRIECAATARGAKRVGELIASSEYALPDRAAP